MNLNPTSEWNLLYDRFYRKIELYSMEWLEKNDKMKNSNDKIDLIKYRLVSAPYGGVIALIRDERKIIKASQSTLKPVIQIFTSSGKELSSFVWNKGKLVGMGWTEQEKLICIVEEGTVFVFNIHGEEISEFSLGKECREIGILECRFWGHGFVVMTKNFQFITISNLLEPRYRILAGTGLKSPPFCWTIIDPAHTLSLNVEVLVATSSTILVVDASGVQDQLIPNGPFVKMSVSPNGKFVACFTEAGLLWVTLTDFSKSISEFDTKSKLPPDQMEWCGTDSIVLYWEQLKLLLMVGPYGDWIKYPYEDSVVFMIPELDGIRIISNEKCEFLQRVPDVTEQIFKIGSTAPAAMLYDAMEHFMNKSPKADENIRTIKDQLKEAVNACIEAAGYERTFNLQKSLLKAASFGKCFLDFFDPTPFVEMCKTLRVLNAVNHSDIGIPLTILQYKMIGAPGLIDRLINRYHHLLAYRICDYLGMKKDKVLVHWACTKVKSSIPDNDIIEMIVSKLANIPGISYAEVASTAYKAGRTELATKLLDYEPRAADQVPLLISMKQSELALNKAIESGDTDLIYLVILQMKKTLSNIEFFQIIYNKPVALDLLISYSKQQDLKLLQDLYRQLDQMNEVANIMVMQSYRQKNLENIDSRIQNLQTALNLYTECKDTFAAKETEDQIKLLLLQKDLEVTLNTKFMDVSLTDTLYKLIVLGQSKRASKIKSDFKVPDKRYWWIKIKALIQIKDWVSLEKFAKEKKSPIGYTPFVDECLQIGEIKEAEKYIPMIQDPQQRVEYYMLIGNYTEAAKIAHSIKNINLLMEIKNKTNNPKLLSQIESFISQLS